MPQTPWITRRHQLNWNNNRPIHVMKCCHTLLKQVSVVLAADDTTPHTASHAVSGLHRCWRWVWSINWAMLLQSPIYGKFPHYAFYPPFHSTFPVSIPHFTFRIPQFRILPPSTIYSVIFRGCIISQLTFQQAYFQCRMDPHSSTFCVFCSSVVLITCP